jgi:hypothetical protein
VDQFTADAMRQQEISIVRIRPRIAFKIVALSNDLAILPKFCNEFLKAARSTISSWRLS